MAPTFLEELGIDPLPALRVALARGGELADLYVEERRHSSIVLDGGRIDAIVCGVDRGAGLRVIRQGRTAYGYTNDLSAAGLAELAGAVGDAAKAGLQAASIATGLSARRSTLDLAPRRDPEGAPLDARLALARRAEARARGAAPEVRQVTVSYGDAHLRLAVANSLGELAEDDRTYTTLTAYVVAGRERELQTGYESAGGVAGLEIFDAIGPEQVADVAVRRALTNLRARPAPSGRMAVVLAADAGGTMVHEAVGHGLEADLAAEGMSVYAGAMGEQVASPLITVIDDATLPGRRGSFRFDDEGTPSERTVLIEGGVLRAYLCDRLHALRHGLRPTGNGRRQSYRHRPICRMTNTMIAPGADDPAEILRSTPRGLYVTQMGGGQVETVSGSFVFEVTEGFLIEDGAVGEPVRGATLTGNGPEVLRAIDRVGRDLGFGLGTCGKDGQNVPVADAQPTLRIPELVVGGPG